MVVNALEVHDAAEVVFVAGAYKKAEYRVLAVKVTMQQYIYGDIVNKNRLMLVATHPCLKEHGGKYRLPIGDFSDAVSYCARDIVESKIAESQKRRFPDRPVKPWKTTPGALQIVARYAPGHIPRAHWMDCYQRQRTMVVADTYCQTGGQVTLWGSQQCSR